MVGYGKQEDARMFHDVGGSPGIPPGMTSHSQCRSVHCFLFLSSPEGSQVLGSWNKETRAQNRVRETAVAAVCNCLVSEGIQCSYLICTLGYALMRLLFLGAFRWVFILVTRIPPGMTS